MGFTPTHAREPTADDEGTDWLYRDPATKRAHRVEIDLVPEKARRIRIQHLDRDMRGRTEWVPIARAKVPWALAEDYKATMATWARAERHRPGSAKSDIALDLFGMYVDEQIAEMYYNGAGGILAIYDVEALARLCGLVPDELLAHEDAFEEGNARYVPWPTVDLVLKALVHRDPQPAVERLASLRSRDRRAAQRILMEGDPWWVAPDLDDDVDAKRVRRWDQMAVNSQKYLSEVVGGENPSLADDFLTLRQMYIELYRLMPSAVQRLGSDRTQISKRLADEIQRLIERPLPRSANLLGAETEED